MRIMTLKGIVMLTTAAIFGFMIRMLAEPLTFSPPYPHCDCSLGGPRSQATPASDVLLASDVSQLVEPFQPSNRFDVISYDYFNKTDIYNNFNDNPGLQLLKHQRNDVQDMVKQAMNLINSGQSIPWRLRKLKNGYRRIDPLRGQEFILDMELFPASGLQIGEVHRLQLVKPFSSAQLISRTRIYNHQMIYLILPISSVSERFYRFMDNFEEACLQTKESVYLLIVLFVGDGHSGDQLVSRVENTVQLLTDKYVHAHIQIIQTSKPFSRGVGLDMGVEELPQNALLFFCDVDVLFSPEFLTRCRENAVRGKQVYYPMVFGQYDPDIAKKYSPSDKVSSMLKINKYTGHWVHYGFGMVCLYSTDYKSVGGFDLNTKGWGGEDVDLYTKHIKSGLKVFRVADPDLIHIYHEKACDPHISASQLRMCRDAAGESLGSRQQLGKMVAEMKARP